MRNPLFIHPPLSRPILGAVAVVWTLSLSGCFQNPFQPEIPVKEPPLIPAPPASEASAIKEQTPLYVGTYADIAKLREQGSTRNPTLIPAVNQAIRLGVLKPVSPLDQFHPEKPIDLKTFRTWATAFQAAQAGVPIPQETANPLSITPPSAVNGKTDDLSSPMNPQQLELIAPDMQLGTHRIADSENLSREALCSLGVFLAKKYTDALSLSPQAVEGMTPGATDTNGDEALSLFKDYAAISAWAKPFVAVAYRDALLQKAFQLNTNQLTVEDGFKPTQPATRAEAIILLHVIFGNVSTPVPAHPEAASVPTSINTANGMKGSYNPPGLTTGSQTTGKPPLPLASQQTTQQTTLQGSQRFQKTVVAD